VIASHTLPVTA